MPNTNSEQNIVGWEDINWTKVERYVLKLQKRIYAASRRGDVKQVRKLQKTLIRSWSNKVLAVRRVTQDNRGYKTAGVDGVKSLSPKERMNLVGQLKIEGKSKPTRRVWIPKPGKDEERPLGIPTMHDRALQGVLKNALEPEWESQFEPNSYGFRPGRSCQDAIKQIKNSIMNKPKFVLDADIAKCFDRINHNTLLQKLGYKGKIRQQIKAWLKLGVIDHRAFTSTSEGTPQGGVISPLLANVALYILATALGGKTEYVNLQLLHGHCHDEKTVLDLIQIRENSYKESLKNTNKKLSKLSLFWDDNDILCFSQKLDAPKTRLDILSSRVKRNFHARFRTGGVKW